LQNDISDGSIGRCREVWMNRQIKLVIAIAAATVVVSSLLVYANINFNPAGSQTGWQRPIENFATALATDCGKVFTMDISGNVNCYNAQTGSSVWNGSSVGGYFSKGLIVSNGRVYGGTQMATVGCLDEATGQFQWSFSGSLGNSAYMKPAPDRIVVRNGIVYSVINIGPGVTAHNATDGTLLWEALPLQMPTSFGNITDLKNWQVSGRVLDGDPFSGNAVYALGGNWSSQYIFKLDTENGNVIWQSGTLLQGFASSVVGSYEGQVIIQKGSQITSFNDATGGPLWSRDIDASIYEPTINGGTLYFGASDGNLYAIKLRDGNQIWKTQLDNQNLISTVNNENITLTAYPIQIDTTKNRIYWSFAVVNNDDEHGTYTGTIYCLDLATGKTIWTQQFEDSGGLYGPSVGMVVNKDAVYLTENTALWVFSASNGNLARTQHFDHYILPPIKAGDQVFIAGDLYLTAYA